MSEPVLLVGEIVGVWTLPQQEALWAWVDAIGGDYTQTYGVELLGEGRVRLYCHKRNAKGNFFAVDGNLARFTVDLTGPPPPYWRDTVNA